MFRTKGMLSKYHATVLLKNRYSTETYKFPSEMNIVNMCGTIEGDIKRLPNRAIKFYLKTLNQDSGYCIHKVAIANGQLLKMLKDQLKADQRVYIGGRLKSNTEHIETELVKDIEIMANELFFLEPNPKLTNETIKDLKEIQPLQMDQNSIEMMAFIGTNLKIRDNSCIFSLKTHFIKRKGKPEESVSSEYHNVLIDNRDPNLLQLAKHLEKHDRVYLNGRIDYMKRIYPDNQEYVSGFIRVVNLVRLKNFSNSRVFKSME